jgi:putative MATE family efflux protein
VQDFTTGSLSRHLLKTSSFMLVTMVFQTLYVLVDLYWVSRLGTAAIAAVAISGNLMFVVLAATQMLGVGTTTLISHATGRKDRAYANVLFTQAQVLSLLVGALFLVLAMALRVEYATRMSADPVTAQLVGDYLLWFIPAMAMQFGLVAIAAALRGIGNFRIGMIVQTGTIIVNIVLAPILIFGWGIGRPLGVAGAAIASLVAIAIGIGWLILYFLPAESYLMFNRHDWTPQPRLWRDLLKIGLPAGAEFALLTVYLVIVYAVSRPFGSAAQAGFGIGMRVLQAAFMPAVALGFAVAPVAGQNVGARRPSRVKRTFIDAAAMAGGTMLLLAIAFQFWPAAIIGVFSPDADAIAYGEEYLRIVSWSFVASGVVFVSSSMFQALGNTVPPLVSSAIRVVLIVAPLAVLTGVPGFNLRWVWYISVGASLVQMTLNLLLLRREYRLRLNFDLAAT